jgi:hypothetical protein
MSLVSLPCAYEVGCIVAPPFSPWAGPPITLTSRRTSRPHSRSVQALASIAAIEALGLRRRHALCARDWTGPSNTSSADVV